MTGVSPGEADSKKNWTKGGGFYRFLPFDCRLAEEDILGSIAHCRMLVGSGFLPAGGDLILNGLREISRTAGNLTISWKIFI